MNQSTRSELSAVNILLVAIGDPKVNDLELSNADVAAARVVLDDIKQEILSVGWWFNSEDAFPLSPNADGELVLPANTLECDSTSTSDGYVIRGNRLYDKANRTFKIDKVVEVDIIFDMGFDEMPRTAYQAITSQAALEFAGSYELDEVQLKRLSAKAVAMGKMLKKSNLRNRDTNIFNSTRANAFLGGMPERS